MKKKDMIALIRAEEAFNKLSDQITALTGGYGVDDDTYGGLFEIYEVLRRNSRFPGKSDHDEDMFRAVVYAINKTPEEKYDLLKKPKK